MGTNAVLECTPVLIPEVTSGREYRGTPQTKEAAMATLCKTYSTEVVARQVVEALRAARVQGRNIRLLTGCQQHDVRREPAGGFAGAVGPNAPVGTYGEGRCLRRQGAGGFAGDPDRQRQGSFANADRCLVVTYEEEAERSRVAGGIAIRRLLRESVAGEVADRMADELQMEHAVLLVEVTEIAPSDTKTRLEELARAA
jgi:hypothetical protein